MSRSTQSARAVGEVGSRVGGGRGKMSFFKRKSRLLPDDFTRKSPIVHYLAGTLMLIKSRRPPTRSRPDFLSLPHRRSVRPPVRPPLLFFGLSLPSASPQRGKIKSDSSILSAASCLSSSSPTPGWNNGGRSSGRRGGTTRKKKKKKERKRKNKTPTMQIFLAEMRGLS